MVFTDCIAYRRAFIGLRLTSCFSHLRISIELVFVHSNGGQGWPSEPHPLRSHCMWDNHCRSCCQDSQNATRRRHRRGKTVVSQEEMHQSQKYELLIVALLSSPPSRVKKEEDVAGKVLCGKTQFAGNTTKI